MSDKVEEMDGSNRDAILMEKYYKRVEEAFEILDSTFKVQPQSDYVFCNYNRTSSKLPNSYIFFIYRSINYGILCLYVQYVCTVCIHVQFCGLNNKGLPSFDLHTM